MEAAIIPAVIATLGGVASYLFTKKNEREAELRKEKLEHYKEFTASISRVVSGDRTAEAQQEYSHACNKLYLFAPQDVLEALQDFQDAMERRPEQSANATIVRQQQLLTALFIRIRRDLGVRPADDEDTFKVMLLAPRVLSAQHPQHDAQGFEDTPTPEKMEP